MFMIGRYTEKLNIATTIIGFYQCIKLIANIKNELVANMKPTFSRIFVPNAMKTGNRNRHSSGISE